MTLSTTISSITLPGNGVLTAFDWNFLIPYQADGTTPAINVYTINGATLTPLVLGTDYSVGAGNIGNPAGGVVTYPLVGSPLPTGQFIVIQRDLNEVQPTAVLNTAFYPNTLEQVADYVTQLIQQLETQFGQFLAPCVVLALPNALENVNVRGLVTDATVTAFGTVVVGGGSNIVPVYCNGAAWVIG